MKVLGLCCLWLVACRAAPATPEPLEPPIRVLLLGDSISIGYTAQVRESLGARAVVVRPTLAGGGAENCAGTTRGVEELERWLALDGGGWDVVHFNFGLHDLKHVDPKSGAGCNDPDAPRQAAPELYERQLREIVATLDQSGARLIFATTTPVPAGGVRPHRDPADVVRYNQLARGVMAQAGVAIDDLYRLVLPRLAELQQPLNVHFSAEGSRVLGEAVADSIRLAAGWPARHVPSEVGAIHQAHLGDDPNGEFEALRAAFAAANPGYEIAWHPGCSSLEAAATSRVLFVQGPASREHEPTVGDILLLPAGEPWRLARGEGLDLVAFELPGELPADLPAIIRPDWDPRITDTPGGCARERSAYRRILLTWLAEKGPYVLHGLNAHRVCINDSFSHYHPREAGFDELYLVQLAPAGARLLTSEQVPAIENETVDRELAASLVESRPLRAGDLVYMPRGTLHRGLGGAVVQVISVPGFVPGGEVGLDHHLLAINERLELVGDAALPLHAAAAGEALVQ